MKIRPLQDRLVVKRVEEQDKSAGGIYLPDNAKEKPARGSVIAVGLGKILDSGDIRPLDIKKGDEVLFGKYAGTEVKINDEDLIVMREEDVLGVIEA